MLRQFFRFVLGIDFPLKLIDVEPPYCRPTKLEPVAVLVQYQGRILIVIRRFFDDLLVRLLLLDRLLGELFLFGVLFSQTIEMGVQPYSVCSVGVVHFGKIIEALIILFDVLVARLSSLFARYFFVQKQLLDLAETGSI